MHIYMDAVSEAYICPGGSVFVYMYIHRVVSRFGRNCSCV